MTVSATVWRSMLFLPTHVDRYIEQAHTRGADAYILDLEDSVPRAQKADARARLASGVNLLLSRGAKVLVRINNESAFSAPDIDAACIAGVSALVLPKINSAIDIGTIGVQLEALEALRGFEPGRIRLIAQIESVDALPRLDEIARSSSRLLGMILGSEDFSVTAGMDPIPEALFAPNQQIVFACRRAGILPFGFPASIADYSDLNSLHCHIRLARRMGFVGAFCIHPSQVAILNEGFTPSTTEVDNAREILLAFDAAQLEGRGAATYRGKMIDAPVVARAREMIAAATTGK